MSRASGSMKRVPTSVHCSAAASTEQGIVWVTVRCLCAWVSLQWRVRKEAMMGLAQLYKKYCLHHEAGKESALKISWIKDKLLHIYYQNSIDDKYGPPCSATFIDIVKFSALDSLALRFPHPHVCVPVGC